MKILVLFDIILHAGRMKLETSSTHIELTLLGRLCFMALIIDATKFLRESCPRSDLSRIFN